MKRARNRQCQFAVAVTVLAVLLTSVLATVLGQPATPITVAKMRTARTRVEAYVKDVQKRCTKDHHGTQDQRTANSLSDEVCDAAKTKYDDAFANYDGWVTALKTAIVVGKERKINEDQDYKDIAKKAGDTGDAFVNYVIENTRSRRGGFLAILGPLADVGIKIWKEIKDKQTAQRNALGKIVEEEGRWRSWDDIARPPAPAATPRP
jgi:hypothetical protein